MFDVRQKLAGKGAKLSTNDSRSGRSDWILTRASEGREGRGRCVMLLTRPECMRMMRQYCVHISQRMYCKRSVLYNLVRYKFLLFCKLSGRVQDHAISTSRVRLTAGRRPAAPPAREAQNASSRLHERPTAPDANPTASPPRSATCAPGCVHLQNPASQSLASNRGLLLGLGALHSRSARPIFQWRDLTSLRKARTTTHPFRLPLPTFALRCDADFIMARLTQLSFGLSRRLAVPEHRILEHFQGHEHTTLHKGGAGAGVILKEME